MNTLIQNVRVFDRDQVVAADTVLLRDAEIAEVDVGLAPSPGGRAVDGRGGTLLPGLIDSHVHAAPGDLRQALVLG